MLQQLITMEKVASGSADIASVVTEADGTSDKQAALPAHYDFRTSYFAKPER